MENIVAFLAAHVPVAGHGLGRGKSEALMHLLQSLRRESERSRLGARLTIVFRS